MGRVLTAALFVLAFAVPGVALAQAGPEHRVNDYQSPRQAALGTGALASGVSTAALSTNPAGMPMSSLYHIEALTGFSPSAGRWTLGTAIVDSSTSRLAAGVSFRGILSSSDDGFTGYDGRVALAYPLADAISIGLSGRYLSLTADAQDGEEEGETLAQGFTMDGSLVIQPFEGFRIAGIARNIIDLDSALTPRLLGGGISYQIEEVFSVGADVLVDTTTFDEVTILAGGGAEYLAAGRVPIRAGYAYDSGRRIHQFTAGLGYVDQAFGVEASLQQDVSGASETSILLAARYFVQ